MKKKISVILYAVLVMTLMLVLGGCVKRVKSEAPVFSFYTPEQADNFWDIFGKNTDYVMDPEECMADNFAYFMYCGMDGPEGDGYENPEIIEGIERILLEK